MSKHPAARDAKFRQAAFVYLHLAVLYEGAVWVLHRANQLPTDRGPVGIWLAAGIVVTAIVFWALYYRQSVWVARLVWFSGLFRIPALLRGAFVPAEGAMLGTAFWLTALIVILINLWMLARAGWDL